jgi:hypothetical protein
VAGAAALGILTVNTPSTRSAAIDSGETGTVNRTIWKGALPAFELFVPLGAAVLRAANPADGHRIRRRFDADVLAPETGDLDRQDVLVRALAQDQPAEPSPAAAAAKQTLEALLHGDQVAHRIPSAYNYTILQRPRSQPHTEPGGHGGTTGVDRNARMLISDYSGIQVYELSSGDTAKEGQSHQHGRRAVARHRVAPHHAREQARACVGPSCRDIRTGRLVDHKFRSEDDVERTILDEHEMQFLYRMESCSIS